MAASRQNVAETIAGIIARRPVLTPVLQAFAPLLEARASLPETLKPLLAESGARLPAWNAARAAQGAPLLAGESLAALAPALRAAARVLLPLLTAQEGCAPHADALTAFFLPEEGGSKDDLAPAGEGSAPTGGEEHSAAAGKHGDTPVLAAEALLTGDGGALEQAAETAQLPPAVLVFALEMVLGPVLRALAASCGTEPWEPVNAWSQGVCPVCGASPSIAWLSKPEFDEKNAYLAGGGGKKHLHCALCGTEWHFRRGTCPACGKDGSGVMEILKESSQSQGERVDWCTACKSYCPVVDLRERESVPHMAAQALGMLHLDMVAAGKGLRPLRPSFWNQF